MKTKLTFASLIRSATSFRKGAPDPLPIAEKPLRVGKKKALAKSTHRVVNATADFGYLKSLSQDQIDRMQAVIKRR